MPRHDPLPRSNPRRSSRRFDARDSEPETIQLLRAQLRQAERAIQAIAKECVALREQLREAGIGPTKANRKRKPPEAGLAVPAVPPKGPMPLQGGAEAPLDFDRRPRATASRGGDASTT